MTLLHTAPATLVLLIISFLVSAAGILYPQIFGSLILHPYSIVFQKRYYNILSADFVHIDWLHLLLNEFMLYAFGSDLEELLNRRYTHGSAIFLGIFFFSMVFGNLLVSVTHRKDRAYSSAGCSGSVMGCLFAFMFLDSKGTALNDAIIGAIPNFYIGPLYMLLLWGYKWRGKNTMINHDLHFYGALGGILSVLALRCCMT